MSGLQDIALDSMGVRGGYWATFYLRKWMVLKVFFQSLGRQIRGEGLSTLYGLHFWIRRRTHGVPRDPCPLLIPFYALNMADGALLRQLPHLQSGAPSPRLLGKLCAWSGDELAYWNLLIGDDQR